MMVFKITFVVFAYWLIGLVVCGFLHRKWAEIRNPHLRTSSQIKPLDIEDFGHLGMLALAALIWPLFVGAVAIMGVAFAIMKLAAGVMKVTLERR